MKGTLKKAKKEGVRGEGRKRLGTGDKEWGNGKEK